MESDIDITKFARVWSLSKRFKTITDRRPACISIQSADDDLCDDFEDLQDVQNCDNDDNVEKVRRHLPLATGQYSVGCVDVMDNVSEQGSFFRLYYPTEKTDVLVGVFFSTY